MLDSFGKFFLTLVGAGVGATAAFYYNRRKQQLDDLKRDYGDAVAAFYTLVARYSAVENFLRKYVSKETGTLGEHEFSIVYQPCPPDQIAIRTLTCFADKDDRELIYEITVSTSSYFSFVESVEERNKDLRAVFDILHEKGHAVGTPILDTDLMTIPQSALVLQQSDNLVKSALHAKKQIAKSVRDLTKATHRKFPDFPKLSVGFEDDGETITKKPGTASP